jgi:hypothetical protein
VEKDVNDNVKSVYAKGGNNYCVIIKRDGDNISKNTIPLITYAREGKDIISSLGPNDILMKSGWYFLVEIGIEEFVSRYKNGDYACLDHLYYVSKITGTDNNIYMLKYNFSKYFNNMKYINSNGNSSALNANSIGIETLKTLKLTPINISKYGLLKM